MNIEIEEFVASIGKEQKRADSQALIKLMGEESGFKAYMTGNIIGFGSYHYVYDSGREGDAIVVGFSPRKANLTVYIMPGFDDYQELLKGLGKHKLGKVCIYINKLADVDTHVLRKIVKQSVKDMMAKYETKEG
ncbi:MAG: hypothetical protein ACI9EW_002474 [Cellvibrionaceae bacterium]|jgi:hypothetical protein